MSDIFSPIPAFTKDPYTVLINAVQTLMTVTIFGNKSKNFITKFDVTPETAMAFEESIENIFDEKCQAIIFHIFNFKPLGYSHVMKFAYEIRVKLAGKKIYNFFYSGQSLFTSGLLISAKIKSTKNDIIFVIRVKGDDRLSIVEYKFTDSGYKQIREDMILKANDESADELREKILKKTKPKHIILYGENVEMPIMKKLKKNVFSHEKIHRLDKNILKESIVQTFKIAKYVRDRSYVKYHVIPKCAKHFAVYFKDREEAFFTAKTGEIVPFTKEDYAVRDAVDLEVRYV
uniref:Uncharacterized protein n=1 Tax=Panagrolaimus sp. PS1159 TaxID=55785 RepID=A0AC35GUJ8_9BILA